MTDFTHIRYFKPSEFTHPEKMSHLLIIKLDRARELAGIPFVITSSYRPGGTTSHGRGQAVDIRCTVSSNRFKIVDSLLKVGFTRIGIYDKHIHADVSTIDPQHVMWWAKSQ